MHRFSIKIKLHLYKKQARLCICRDMAGGSKHELECARQKSLYIFQYKHCSKSWWGAAGNNTCRRCKKTVNKLPLESMIGIGWFECPCGRTFAGFCRGNVKSPCNACMSHLLPSFIVPGDDAAGSKKKAMHSCSVCRGCPPCPIVEAVKNGARAR